MNDDLKSVKHSASSTRSSIDFLKEKLVYEGARSLILKRKQERLKKVKKFVQVTLVEFLKEEAMVKRKIGKYDFEGAFLGIKKNLEVLEELCKQHNVRAFRVMKERF